MPFYTYMLVLLLSLCLGQSRLEAQDTRRIGGAEEPNLPQFAPVLSPDGSLLLYSETGNHANFGQKDLADIWICQQLGDNQWSRPVNAGMPINSAQNDQCLAINLDENEIYLLQEDEYGKKSITQSKRSFRSWSTPQNMQIEPWDSAFQILHGFVSNDGQTLLLCISHPDSTQQSDIYVAQREGELLWKNLQSLGQSINTPGQERSAFLAADGLTLYFASNGHKGFGGQDLYMSRRNSTSWTDWSPPVNLGSDFNSKADEWGFYTSVIGEKGWWTRTEAKKTQILSANIPGALKAQAVILVKGYVYLPQSKIPAGNVTVSLNYFDTKRNTRVMRQGISDLQGKYQLLLPRNAEMTLNALSGQLFSPTYNLLRKGPAVSEGEDSDEMMSSLLAANPTYRQVEEEIEALQLAYNQNLVALKNLNKERQSYVTAILQQWEDTASINFNKTLESGLNKLREDYEAAKKQQALSKFHDGPQKFNDQTNVYNAFIPTDFEDFVRIIEIQQRWEILPVTAQSLILQMLNEEVKKQDKEIKPDERAIWRIQREQILKNPTLLLLPEADLNKWPGIFSPCFEWQEIASRDISNFLLQKNQNELTTQIKTDVRNYLRSLLDMRILAAQSAAMNQEIRIKIEGQLRIERGFQYRPSTRPAVASDFAIDTLLVIAANELEQDIQLFDPVVEKTITLENIVFLPNQSELDSSSYAEIHRLATFLKENPSLAIEIVAHTNNHCTYNFATELTNRRAERIADLLVLDQVPIERIRARGSGKEQPIATNSSPAGRLANQRIEIVFIDQ